MLTARPAVRAYTQYLQIPARKSSTAIRERCVKPSLMYAQMPPRVASRTRRRAVRLALELRYSHRERIDGVSLKFHRISMRRDGLINVLRIDKNAD